MHPGAGACIFQHKKLEKEDLLFVFVIMDALGVMA